MNRLQLLILAVFFPLTLLMGASREAVYRVDVEKNLEPLLNIEVYSQIISIPYQPEIVLRDLLPGTVSIDCSELEDGAYSVKFNADGFATVKKQFTINNGRVAQEKGKKVSLFKERYVVLEYCVNLDGQRDLSNGNLEEGVYALTHRGALPYFEQDWFIEQNVSGIKPLFTLMPHRVTPEFGYKVERGNRKFEVYDRAPAPKDYKLGALQLKKGMVFYYRVQGVRGGSEGRYYGKVMVVDITNELPDGIKVRSYRGR